MSEVLTIPSTEAKTKPKVKRLTPKEKRFVEEYPVDLNKTQAVFRAGYSPASENAAAQQGIELLRKPHIQEAISQRLEEKGFFAEIEMFKTIREAKRIAFFDVRKLFNNDGSPKGISELDDDTAACIAGVEVLEVFEGSGDKRKFVGYLKKYRLADKNAALDKLFRYMALYKDPGTKENPIQHQVQIVYEKLHTNN